MSAGDDDRLLALVREAFAAEPPKRLGVAVSGGGDSMALLHLLHRAGFMLEAATVDHGLRPEAAEEARFVAKICRGLGVPHEVLVWEHGAIAGNLQDAARRARYGLLADWARARGLADVALGHTADDVAETFLMELARGAGIDGLAAMRARFTRAGIQWHRPLLDATRPELRDYLSRQGVSWVEDPSNANPKFQRVKARQVLAELAPLGLDARALDGASERLASARVALDWATAEAAARIGREAAGEAILERAPLLALPYELARRLVSGALCWINSAEYPPRGAEVARLLRAIAEGRSATLAGCRVRAGQEEIAIAREPKAVGPPRPTTEIWDGRWRLEGPHAAALELRALGAEGLKHCPDWRRTGASRAALLVSPAVWRGQTLVAAPLAGLGAVWRANPLIPFTAAFTAH